MLTTTQAFDKFRQRLELGDKEKKDASKRQTDVRECIRGGFDLVRDFLSGSYRAATAFLLDLIARLQDSARVPMIDVRAYARWLAS